MAIDRQRRGLLAAAVLGALAACGGGAAARDGIALYGDSLTSGRALAVTPAQRLRAALGERVDDFSAPGMRAMDAGELVRSTLVATPAAVAALLFGGSDVIGGTSPAAFDQDMRALVATARAAGARPVLATIIRHPDYMDGVQALNAVLWRVAGDTGTPIADVFALPQGGFVPDGIHPDQAYSDARISVIAEVIRAVLHP